MIIYPLCESNVYVIAPGANITTSSPLTEKFAQQFPEHNLFEVRPLFLLHLDFIFSNYLRVQVIEEFSLPSTMVYKLNPLTHPEEQSELVQIVTWMLRHRLLMQLHTYVCFMPTKKGMVQVDVSSLSSSLILHFYPYSRYLITGHASNLSQQISKLQHQLRSKWLRSGHLQLTGSQRQRS